MLHICEDTQHLMCSDYATGVVSVWEH